MPGEQDAKPGARALPARTAPPAGATRSDGKVGNGNSALDRRQALKVIALAAAAPALASCGPDGDTEEGNGADTGPPTGDVAETPNPVSNPRARGDAWDPDLINPTIPWERKLSAEDLASLAVLCDLIIPADDRSPSASSLGAHDFIDEWVSAPYDGNRNDLVLIRGGLRWLDLEAAKRFGDGEPARPRFRELAPARRTRICDDICYPAETPDGLKFAARFFDRVRYLTSTAFWTTREGMEDLRYLGNVPLPSWEPPPAEVLRHIGLA